LKAFGVLGLQPLACLAPRPSRPLALAPNSFVQPACACQTPQDQAKCYVRPSLRTLQKSKTKTTRATIVPSMPIVLYMCAAALLHCGIHRAFAVWPRLRPPSVPYHSSTEWIEPAQTNTRMMDRSTASCTAHRRKRKTQKQGKAKTARARHSDTYPPLRYAKQLGPHGNSKKVVQPPSRQSTAGLNSPENSPGAMVSGLWDCWNCRLAFLRLTNGPRLVEGREVGRLWAPPA
jgi:hypothetical protein